MKISRPFAMTNALTVMQNRYGVDGSQAHKYSYQYSTGSDGAPWTAHTAENQAVENGNYSNSNYYHPQPTGPATGNVQEIPNTASFTSSSMSGSANVAQEYSGYTPYQPSSDPHNYSNTGYSNYYSGYQQQPSQSYPQPAGAYQNTGAPQPAGAYQNTGAPQPAGAYQNTGAPQPAGAYQNQGPPQPAGAYQNTGAPQPLSSFQNPGSYAGTASYSGTYYNPPDYQTAGGYQSTNYNNQTAGNYPSTNYSNHTPASNQGNYTDYTSNPYQNYTPDAANTHSSTIATATPVHYQQNYQQWSDYYSQTEVPCAPGTEKLSATNAYSQSFPAPGVTNEMPASNSQPAPSYVQPWMQETDSSQPPSQQVQILLSRGSRANFASLSLFEFSMLFCLQLLDKMCVILLRNQLGKRVIVTDLLATKQYCVESILEFRFMCRQFRHDL